MLTYADICSLWTAQERLVLVDVGANTGCFTLMALDPPALHVVAVEPIGRSKPLLLAKLNLCY
jgi:precorrin-6B methylase 2